MKTIETKDKTTHGDLATVANALCVGYDPQGSDLVYRAVGYTWPLCNKTHKQTPKHPDPFAVAGELKALGIDCHTLSASLLAASVCEASLPIEKINEAFGEKIAALVKSVRWLHSFREGTLVQQEDADSAEQSERLRRMVLAMVEDVRAVLIKLAHVVVRLKMLAHVSYDERRRIAHESLTLYAPLANRLGVGQLKWQMEDLAFRALEPQAYKRLATSLEERRVEREVYVDDLVTRLRAQLAEAGIDKAGVFGRAKHIYSIWKKMQRKQIEFAEVFDVRAVRVLVSEVSECYAVLGLVHGNWQHIPREFDDYIANPKENGYQSLHTAVIGPGGKAIEVQIRTRQMDDDAELGVAAHWRYKEGGALDESLQRSINALRQLLEVESDDTDLFDSVSSDFFSDRVFVLTPKGKIVDLPQGSTPLDFAYQIHTQVGHRCRGAKINGSITTLTQVLQNGDQVNILTTRESRPSRDWLNRSLGYLATSRARAKVRSWFNIQDHEQHIEDGRNILERTLKRLNAHAVSLEKLTHKLNFEKQSELFAAIGRNLISTAQVDAAVYALETPHPEQALLPVRRTKRSSVGSSGSTEGISVRGVGSLLTQISRCCKPVPYDPIVGYITRGKGVSVHRRDCANILNLSEGDQLRMIEVEWGDERTQAYPVDLQVIAYDRPALLRDISQIMADQNLNVTAVNTQSDADEQTACMNLTVELSDVEQLSRTMDKLRQLSNVLQVERRK